ncbi:hypothetical protein EI94DRAFT_1707418 [Lactarius quietus]|nr:hypothetical protein EI94DRAFT_1707418 [Lactarius quietus]
MGGLKFLIHAMLAMKYIPANARADGDIARAMHAEAGAAPFRFMSIDNAISNLLRFDWYALLLGMQDKPELASPVGAETRAKKRIGFEGPVSGLALHHHHPPCAKCNVPGHIFDESCTRY